MSASISTTDADRARALVLEHGWNATAYQILNPGIAHWFSARGDAVLGYARFHGVYVVAGAPVCTADRLPDVVEEFERAMRADGSHVCYFGAEGRLEQLLRTDTRRAFVILGGQPVWHPLAWGPIVERHASLRAQIQRARNKGVDVTEWNAARARGRADLWRCLREWGATRGLPPMHFLVEPRTLDRLEDRRTFVAERTGYGVVGFLLASPVPVRRGWLVEQIIRGRGAPNGCNELLIDTAMRTFAAEGASYVTLGLSPLSRRAHLDQTINPLWLRYALAWMRAHGRRFYNFDGLDAFKAKLDPERWEPVYAIADGRRVLPRTLFAISAAFSGGSPIAFVARAVLGAARMEAVWALESMRGERVKG
ncbi:MAG: phosphatidylglycerol lysyltransferase domain-containing protein [Gemmatimonadaceae bacterium]